MTSYFLPLKELTSKTYFPRPSMTIFLFSMDQNICNTLQCPPHLSPKYDQGDLSYFYWIGPSKLSPKEGKIYKS